MAQDEKPYRAIERTVRTLRSSPVVDQVRLPREDQLKLSGPFASRETFLETGFASLGELLHMTDLHTGSRVLDYGCGLGRLALPFAAFLDGGSYVGIDANRESYDHCVDAFADFESHRFEFVNLQSEMYNPDGHEHGELNDSAFDSEFDLAFLYSVFTHVLPADIDGLLSYLFAALKPGGEVFTTFFLLNEWSLAQIDAGVSKRAFPFAYGEARINNQNVPEGAVAYDETDVLRRFDQAGFGDVFVSHGRWSGPRERGFHPHHQDIIIARK